MNALALHRTTFVVFVTAVSRGRTAGKFVVTAIAMRVVNIVTYTVVIMGHGIVMHLTWYIIKILYHSIQYLNKLDTAPGKRQRNTQVLNCQFRTAVTKTRQVHF